MASTRPSRVGRYKILSRLASGGMSKVYRAIAVGAEDEVALKMTPLENDLDVEVADYQREVMVARRVEHPNVITATDHGCAAGHIFLVMPLVNGATLSNVTRLRDPSRKPSSPKSSAYRDKWAVPLIDGQWGQVAGIGLQIADALVACHEAGVIHRDIKPGNIIMNRGGDSFLMDFGLAWLRRGQRGHQLKTKAGTARYLPPEIFDGDRDERSDIYSLGVTLHELATGRKLWGHIDHKTVSEKRPSLEVPLVHEIRPDVPQILADCIEQAAHDNPDERHQTARELRDHLQIVAERFPQPTENSESALQSRAWTVGNESLSEAVWFG